MFLIYSFRLNFELFSASIILDSVGKFVLVALRREIFGVSTFYLSLTILRESRRDPSSCLV